jgi:polyphosphate kinase
MAMKPPSKSTSGPTARTSAKKVRRQLSMGGKKKKGPVAEGEVRRKKKPVHQVEHTDMGPEFLNRDVQWLQFNSRVLAEAVDARTPLLERVRFLGIFTSNLDEFFMKRIGGLQRQAALGLQRKTGGQTAAELLGILRSQTRELQESQANSYAKDIKPELEKNGIQLLVWQELTDEEKDFAAHYFKKNVFPVLTPLAVDPGLPFPFISNLSVSFGVTLKHPEREEKLFARIKVPKIFPQWLELQTTINHPGIFRFISLMELITHNLHGLFPDMGIVDVMPFRITRNAEIERDEEEADDLLEMVAEELKQRRFADVVRLEHGPNPDPWMLEFLMTELELTTSEVFELKSLLDFTDLKPLVDLNIPNLKYAPWSQLVPPRLIDERESIFDIIAQGDLLVHHPYESFGASVERFIRSAIDDRNVLAIKMTLYRTGDDSPFIPLLIRAAEMGKQVVVLIELKARFDEERNIHWAQALENAGVHVVYGVVGLKTHAKVALVIRQEPEGVRCYVHLGTGNYHKTTAKTYTDLGLFSARSELTEDAVELFHFLTGRSLKRTYNKLLVAPGTMKDRILDLIRREMDHAKAGRPGRIIIKCNSLEEVSICRALYDASQAGVEIDIIVRGFCCLRPRVRGLSERIRVISVIGRFLEHSRTFYFGNGQSDPLLGDFYIGSADMMYRNLLARIETMAPIEEPGLKDRIWEIFEIMLNDRRSAWEMQPDGVYIQLRPRTQAEELGTQQNLMLATQARHQKIIADLEAQAVSVNEPETPL